MRTINLDDSPPTPGTTGTTGNGTPPPPESGPGTAPPRTAPILKLEGQVRDFHAQAGTYLGMFMPQLPTGMLLATNADGIAEAWADLAAQDPSVRRVLEKVLAGGAWANVIGTYIVGVFLPTLAYADKLPPFASHMRDGIIAMTLQTNPAFAAAVQQAGGQHS